MVGSTTTEYSGNHIYENNVLQFFNHPEGYVKTVIASGSAAISSFEYVYQYKDHLGNVRLSYTDNNNDGIIQTGSTTEIIEESNYYPFGLKHKGYNNVIVGSTNHHKDFQGQELTEDLGLNVHEWKYRVSDPTIGRFWQIDPLSEDYVYNGTYNFSENRVIDSAELEGLERIFAADGKFIGQVGENEKIRVSYDNNHSETKNLVSTANNTKLSSEERQSAAAKINDNSFNTYKSADDAAHSFAQGTNKASMKMNKEIGAAIYRVELKVLSPDATVFVLTPSKVGSKNGIDINALVGPEVDGQTLSMPGELEGFVHTHGMGSNDFSTYSTGLPGDGDGDKQISKDTGKPVYMSNKAGELKVFDYNNGGERRLSKYIRTWDWSKGK